MRTSRLLSVLFLVPLVAAAADVPFRDVPSTAWYASVVARGVSLGIVSGYRDADGRPTGEFRPAGTVTIAEALKMAIEGEGVTGLYQRRSCPEECPLATDVTNWAAPYVQIAREWKFQVVEPGVALDRPASRRQVAQIVADAFRIDTSHAPESAPFSDVSVTSKYANAIGMLKEFGIVSGDLDAQGKPLGVFRPVATINRAEALKMVLAAGDRFLELPQQNSDGTFSFESGGVFPFTFRYPSDTVWTENSPEGMTSDFQIDLHPRNDDATTLVVIRAYVDGHRPAAGASSSAAAYKTFEDGKRFVEVLTPDGKPNATWTSVTSTFQFTP